MGEIVNIYLMDYCTRIIIYLDDQRELMIIKVNEHIASFGSCVVLLIMQFGHCLITMNICPIPT